MDFEWRFGAFKIYEGGNTMSIFDLYLRKFAGLPSQPTSNKKLNWVATCYWNGFIYVSLVEVPHFYLSIRQRALRWSLHVGNEVLIVAVLALHRRRESGR